MNAVLDKLQLCLNEEKTAKNELIKKVSAKEKQITYYLNDIEEKDQEIKKLTKQKNQLINSRDSQAKMLNLTIDGLNMQIAEFNRIGMKF